MCGWVEGKRILIMPNSVWNFKNAHIFPFFYTLREYIKSQSKQYIEILHSTYLSPHISTQRAVALLKVWQASLESTHIPTTLFIIITFDRHMCFYVTLAEDYMPLVINLIQALQVNCSRVNMESSANKLLLGNWTLSLNFLKCKMD